MEPTQPGGIDEYIRGFPPGVQEELQALRRIIRSVAPEARETLKYRMPTYVLGENLVHFAGYARHIGFYPTPSAIEAFRGELGGYVFAKGSVQFPLGQPLPADLVRRMVEFRVREVGEKAAARARKRRKQGTAG